MSPPLAATYQPVASVLQQLQATLVQSPGCTAAGEAATASGAQKLPSMPPGADGVSLVQLQQAAAALEAISSMRQPGSGVIPTTAAAASLPGDARQQAAAAVACLEALLQALLQPPEQLLSGLSGAPSEPTAGQELAGEHFFAVAAVQLRLAALLLPLLQGALKASACVRADQQHRQAAADGDKSSGGGRRARNKARHFVGVVEIEELPADTKEQPHSSSSNGSSTQEEEVQCRLDVVLPRVLQAAALYADDGSAAAAAVAAGQVDGSNSNSACTGAHTHLLGSFATDVTRRSWQLYSPWSNTACQQAARHLMQHVARQAAPGDSSSSSSSSSSQGDGDAEQRQNSEEALLCAVMPCVLSGLRDAVLAQHRYKQAQENGGADMVAYSGPSTFQRCLAARQLAWLVQQLRQASSLSEEVLGRLLPLLLAAGDDPSPSVQQYGYAGLAWLGAHARPASLQWQGALLRAELLRMVVGCDAACWATAMPAATSLALALEGSDPRSATLHALLQELVTEAARGAQHQQQQRLVFMACVARLAPAMGLHTLRHFAALLPLLLEWSHAYDADSASAALQVLALLAVCTWPRMGVHASVLAKHARAVLRGAAAAGARREEARGGSKLACHAARQLLDVLDSLPSVG